MKCVLLGDPIVPSNYMVRVLSALKDRGVELFTLDWKSELTAAEFVTVNREMESRGPMNLSTELLPVLAEAEIIVTNFAPLSAQAIKSAPELRLIACSRSGTENIDLEAAREKGITVVNSPGRNATAVADYTIGLIIALSRHIAAAHCKMKQGIWEDEWSKAENLSHDLAGKTIGIIGYGNIGRKVAVRARSFEMRILVYDPYLDSGPKHDKVAIVDLHTLLRESDFVTIHTRLTPETRSLIGETELGLMKARSFLINTARAEIVDGAALLRFLGSGKLGAALDVFEQEPMAPTHELMKLDNVLLTPHLAGSTVEAELENGLKMVAEEIIRLLEGRGQRNVVH